MNPRCCKEMREHMKDSEEDRFQWGGIVPGNNGSWDVPGCCGGGCYILTDIKYCPWCGKSL